MGFLGLLPILFSTYLRVLLEMKKAEAFADLCLLEVE
jgi:hypothetical protein